MPAPAAKASNRPRLLQQRPDKHAQQGGGRKGFFSGPFFYLFVLGAPIVLACLSLKFLADVPMRGSDVEVLLPPIPAPVNDSGLTWGTLRAQHYFGLRTRHPHSPLFGMMWFDQPQGGHPNIRHWCHDKEVNSYGWTQADGRSFGRQTINDTTVLLQTDWVNTKESTFTARVTSKPHKAKKQNGAAAPRVNFYFYLALESPAHGRLWLQESKEIAIEGRTEELGEFVLKIESAKREEAIVTDLLLPRVNLARLNDHVLEKMRVSQTQHGIAYVLAQGEQKVTEGTFAVMAINAPAETSFEITFSRAAAHQPPPTGAAFDGILTKRVEQFEQRFERAFALAEKNYSPSESAMARVALSNMLGSIGVWHGSNKVKQFGGIVPYGPHTLLSAVPSRPFFPRGFLWDEGFHQLLISRFDPVLSLECVTSWLNTMNVNGWIPREMILSAEAEAKVPAEYVAQDPSVANPPSLFYLLDTVTRDSMFVNQHRATFSAIYFKAAKWYQWLITSQAGRYSDSLRWRGRNGTTKAELNPKTLASGLDDFPRASHPSDKEYHLDLRCWMAVASRVLARLAETFSTADEAESYRRKYTELSDFGNLVQRHWTEEGKQFADFGLHSLNVRLVQREKLVQGHHGNTKETWMERAVDEPPKERHVSDAMGYVGLFPLIAHIVPATEHAKLRAILGHLNDPEELWTPFGIRSLSTLSPYYQARNTEHDPPYWRGSIWMPINYLLLRSLGEYAAEPGLDAALREEFVGTHRRLKKALVGNLAKGKGTHPMTGWTSLVLMVMSEDDL
ncbi:mogs-1 [Pristionchus pacificus]|uniref:Mannosyl-oligosaccharide glucosidase n=1 Tax=Pristionchus pacificus TaxID=54126 RepID=A0A2A6BW28_PRIPA|nr:mogs-1 [Pristionchus pacificus]|eukprot:PDM70068.1 mogs-1 [Pristionchus pacificus]